MKKMNEILNYFAFVKKGNWDKMYEAIQTREKKVTEKIEDFWNIEKNNYISIVDDDYPDNFKKIYMPPLILYYAGNKEIMQKRNNISLYGNITENDFLKIVNRIVPKEGVVFSLKMTEQNLKFAKKFAADGYDFIIVDSGAFNSKLADELKAIPNILYMSELPELKEISISKQQLFERILLGVSTQSIFLNPNDQPEEYMKFVNINAFEKRESYFIGNKANVPENLPGINVEIANIKFAKTGNGLLSGSTPKADEKEDHPEQKPDQSSKSTSQSRNN